MATRNTSRAVCCRPFSRGTLLVLVWSTLLSSCVWFDYNSLHLTLPPEFQVRFEYVYYILWVLLPLSGWATDAWLGRYRAITVGFFLSPIAVLLFQAAFVMMQFSDNWTAMPVLSFTLLCIAVLIGTVGFGSFYTSLLPFTLDQMIGASAEELSAAVQWCFWGFNIGLFTVKLLYCLPIPTSTQFQDILHVANLLFSSVSLSAVLVSDCLCHKWLDTRDKININPIKLIFRVLNYARKNKYPRNCSAFTYIDEEQPSRLDFGKDKFGGPFTEEEVEDVKTIFRLLPLFACVPGAVLTLGVDSNDAFHLHAISTYEQKYVCIATLNEIVFFLTPVLLIPSYRFILYSLFYNYIPSMLKRVGAGLFLCLVSTLMNLTLDTVGHLHSNTTHCMFDTNTGSHDSLFIPLHWLLIMDIINGVGGTLVLCTSIEFIMAQTPNRMRGVMMGLGATTAGVSIIAHKLIKLLFSYLNISTPSCEFYYYLVLSLLILLILVLFTIVAKHNRLRERERHVNIQAVVEEHYERYLDQEEEYMREAASRYQQH